MLSLFNALYCRHPHAIPTLLLASLGVTLATWITWPLLPQFARALPSGDSPCGTVPMLNSWVLWWNASQLRYGFEQYWHAPIFAPEYGAMAFSEPQPATMLAAPIVWLFSIPAGYNTYLFFSVSMNLAVGYWFLRSCRCTPLPSLAGGIGVALHPLAIENIEAVQLLPMWGLLLTIRGILGLWETPDLKHSLLFAAGFIVTTLCCIHHAFFFVLLMPAILLGLAFLSGWRSPFASNLSCSRFVGWGLFAVTMVAVAVGPMLTTLHQIHQDHEFVRDVGKVQVLSAKIDSWTAPQFFGLELAGDSSFHLLPGWSRALLAATCLPLVLRRSRITIILLFGLVASSFLFSFGANIGLSSSPENSVWNLACEWMTPLARVRSPYRFAYFTQLGVILLAAIATNHIMRRARVYSWRRKRSSGSSSLSRAIRTHALSFCLLAIVAAEVIPPPCYLTRPPLAEFTPDWAYFLRTQSHPEDRVLCLPVAANSSEEAHEISTKWMLYGTQHSCVILNGYSGFTPKSWIDLRKQLRLPDWSGETFDRLRAIETRFIVVRRDLSKVNLEPYANQVERIFQDPQYEVWRVREMTP